MNDDHERRLATIEANIINIGATVSNTNTILRESINDRLNKHQEVIQRLTKIETNQDTYKEKQAQCDRTCLGIQDKVSELEAANSRRAGEVFITNALITSAVSGIIAIGAVLLGKYK